MKTSRIISFILAVLLLIAVVPVSTAAAEPVIIDFHTASSITSHVHSKSLTNANFCASEGTARFYSTSSEETTSASVTLTTGNVSGMSYAVLTYKAPSANTIKAKTAQVSFSSTTSFTNAASYDFAPIEGYLYHSEIIDLDEAGVAGTVSYINLKFTATRYQDMLYVSSVAFFDDMTEAEDYAADECLYANGSAYLNLKSEDDIYCGYDLDKYTQYYWGDEDLVYSEAVFPLENKNGSIDPISLMYSADRILSVKLASCRKEFHEGIDYTISDGKLVILESGSIPTIDWSDNYLTYEYPYRWSYKLLDGSGYYLAWGEGDFFHSRQLSVTYTHTDEWTGPVPQSKASLLPKTEAKLSRGDDVNIVFFGDSITGGGNSSGDIGQTPRAESWCNMTAKKLDEMYASDITYTISYGGGASAEWGAGVVGDEVISHNPDLVFIAFGINEGLQQDDSSIFRESTEQMISDIQTALPDCEIILVASQLGNPAIFRLTKQYEHQTILHSLERTGVAVADVTEMHDYMLTLKRYEDMTGNNLCHVNDFFARFYAQTMLATIEADFIPYDINGDGAVNIRDALRLKQYLAGKAVTAVTAALDVNGDGNVNIEDSYMLRRRLAGLI